MYSPKNDVDTYDIGYSPKIEMGKLDILTKDSDGIT